jgi:ABC-2 type transport system ATP-binding protein
VIGRGRVIADTSMQRFVRQASRKLVRVRTPQAAELRRILVSSEVEVAGEVEVASVEPGVLEVTGLTAAQVGEAAAEHGLVLHELTPLQASLEEAFMELTRDEVEFVTPASAGEADRLEVAA